MRELGLQLWIIAVAVGRTLTTQAFQDDMLKKCGTASEATNIRTAICGLLRGKTGDNTYPTDPEQALDALLEFESAHDICGEEYREIRKQMIYGHLSAGSVAETTQLYGLMGDCQSMASFIGPEAYELQPVLNDVREVYANHFPPGIPTIIPTTVATIPTTVATNSTTVATNSTTVTTILTTPSSVGSTAVATISILIIALLVTL